MTTLKRLLLSAWDSIAAPFRLMGETQRMTTEVVSAWLSPGAPVAERAAALAEQVAAAGIARPGMTRGEVEMMAKVARYKADVAAAERLNASVRAAIDFAGQDLGEAWTTEQLAAWLEDCPFLPNEVNLREVDWSQFEEEDGRVRFTGWTDDALRDEPQQIHSLTGKALLDAIQRLSAGRVAA